MQAELQINENITIASFELWFTSSRSSGPGGQHVNKTNSRVTLYWNIAGTTALDRRQKALVLRRLGSRVSGEGVLSISVEDSRSQHRNKEIARQRLAEIVNTALKVTKKRIPTRATRASQRRRLQDKRCRAATIKMRKTPSED